MKSTFILAAVLLFVALPAAQADFELDRKIPAPGTPPGCAWGTVEGLGTIHRPAAPDLLFVLVRCDTTSHLYILDPVDGDVLRYAEVNFSPPDCGTFYSQVSGGEHWYGNVFWIAEDCGNFVEVMWTADTLYVIDSFMTAYHDDPWGLTIRNDTLFAANSYYGELNLVDTVGVILAEYSLPASVTPPGALTIYRGSLFGAARDVDSVITEMTLEAAVVDTHLLLPPSARLYPRAATVLEGQMFVGGNYDSIAVFDFKTYATPLEPATDESVEVVPDRMSITFDSILDSGWVYVDVTDSQACSPPAGVTFVSDFYEVTTTSRLEYISEVAISDSFPAGLPFGRMRTFTRPSGGCGVFRDITVEAADVSPSLRIYARQKSEDDEFSFFAAAIDNRAPGGVVDLKFTYLEGHIESGQDSIPQAAYARISDLLERAQNQWTAGHPLTSAVLVDSIAVVARNASAIPHIYNPLDPGKNLAGRIISRAHTLSFSLRYYRTWLAGIDPGPEPPGLDVLVRPNPSGSSVLIELVAPGRDQVEVAVYTVRGRLVKRLFTGRPAGGRLSLEWTGINATGTPVSPGIYFVIAREGGRTATRKIVLR